MNLAGFFLAFTVHGVANCVLRGRRSIWHSFALCSAVKFWRAVALEVAFFSALFYLEVRWKRSFVWCLHAAVPLRFFVVVVLCSVDFVAVATFSAAFCNVTLSFRSDVVALLRGSLEFAGMLDFVAAHVMVCFS